MKDDVIVLDNVCAVERVTIPYLEEGGIVVCRGPNGSGKTLGVLGGVERLLGGDNKLSVRDGAAGRGSVSWGDARLTIGASTRMKGEAECRSIADDLSIMELVEPIAKTAQTADKMRTRALCRLTNATADPALFYDLVGGKGEFDRHVKAATLVNVDLVDLQEAIARDLHEAKRIATEKADKASGEANVYRHATEGVDLKAEADSDVLGSALASAIVTRDAIKVEADAFALSRENAVNAENALDRAVEAYKGPDAKSSREALVAVRLEKDAAFVGLADAQRLVDQEERKEVLAEAAYDAATEHEASMAEWRESIDAVKHQSPPSDDTITKSEEAIVAAQAAVEKGMVVRKAIQHAELYEAAKAERDDMNAEAAKLYDAAIGCESILAEAVHAEGLSLQLGRWIVKTADRGDVFFHDLSKGEKASLCIQWVTRELRARGAGRALIPFPQELWEGLDLDNRRKLDATCKELKVCVLTAACDHDVSGEELRVETYDDNPNPKEPDDES